MKEFLNGSLIYRWLTAAALWLDRQWDKSFLALIFTERAEKTGEGSIFGRLFDFLHRALNKLFRLLRLDKALNGSIFTKSFFWCCLAAACAPILPTMATLGIVLISFLSVILRFGMSREEKLFYSPITKWVLLYAFVYVVCTITSVTFSGSLKSGALTTAFVLFAAALMCSVKTRDQLKLIIYLLVGAGLIVSLYGFFQVFTGVESSKTWVDMDSFSNITLRVYSTLDNPNVLGEYLLLIIPLGGACLINAKTANGRLAAAAATGAMIVCMLLTQSRGGWLGLIFAAAIFLVLIDRRLIVLGVVVLVCLPFVLPSSILARFASITDFSDSSTSYRIYIWMATVNMLKDYWFCGVGTGLTAYNAVYPAYSFNTVVAPHSHNLYLQIMCESGICGIFIFLALIVSCVRTLGTAIRRAASKEKRIELIAMMSGLGGFLLQGMTDYSFYNYRVTLIFWVYVALIALASGLPEEEK